MEPVEAGAVVCLLNRGPGENVFDRNMFTQPVVAAFCYVLDLTERMTMAAAANSTKDLLAKGISLDQLPD